MSRLPLDNRDGYPAVHRRSRAIRPSHLPIRHAADNAGVGQAFQPDNVRLESLTYENSPREIELLHYRPHNVYPVVMARRALRKIDSSLDLTGRLRTFDDLPMPWRAEQLFARQAPLEVEVGTGKGLFLASAAASVPEHDFLGIEVSRKYARYAAARLAKCQVANACVVHGDALRVFRERLADRSLAAVHVYFPDPWWKARHKKRRVMNAAFLSDVERTLAAGGRLHFWTDVEEYFQTTVELIGEATRLQGPLQVPERMPEHDLDYRTHFERRTRLADESVYRAEFVRALVE